MNWRLLPIFILIVSQAEAERFARSESFFADDFPVARNVRTSVNNPPPLPPGVGRPVVTPMPVPQDPLRPPVPRPRPQTPARPGSGELLPGMLDPNAPPENRSQRSPVWKPFLRRFNQCAPGCQPIRYNAYRDGVGDNPSSCHYSGRSIDVFGLKCFNEDLRGVTYLAVNSTRDNGRFAALVQCMSGDAPPPPKPGKRRRHLRLREGLGCLWHNGAALTQGHRDHAHFSIGCGGGRW